MDNCKAAKQASVSNMTGSTISPSHINMISSVALV
jgi:hypothetical protein